MKNRLFSIYIFCIIGLLWISSCSQVSIPLPTLSPSSTIEPAFLKSTPSITITSVPPTATPSPLPSLTQSVTPISEICSPSVWQQDSIYVLSPKRFGSIGPGNSKEFDQILISHNPDWEEYRQQHDDDMWTAGVIISQYAFYPHGKGVSPSVIFVTYAVERDWELPAYGAMIAKVEQIRVSLNTAESDWFLDEVDRTKLPPIKNGASYALYMYFDGDIDLLEKWCRTYLDVFGESPLDEYGG
jgi:hypothetical protein